MITHSIIRSRSQRRASLFAKTQLAAETEKGDTTTFNSPDKERRTAEGIKRRRHSSIQWTRSHGSSSTCRRLSSVPSVKKFRDRRTSHRHSHIQSQKSCGSNTCRRSSLLRSIISDIDGDSSEDRKVYVGPKQFRRLSYVGFDESAAEDGERKVSAISTVDAGETKRARFGGPADNLSYDHIARFDMTDYEMFSCWYHRRDLKEIKIDVAEKLMHFRNGGDEKDDFVCWRGLEHIMNHELMEEKRERRRAVVDAVLMEQEIQASCEEKGKDPEAIARISVAVTKMSRDMAESMGEKDAANAAQTGMLSSCMRRNTCGSTSAAA